MSLSIEKHKSLEFKKISIGLVPNYSCIKFRTFCIDKIKQCCLCHFITSNMHATMGGTFKSLASEISKSNPNYRL